MICSAGSLAPVYTGLTCEDATDDLGHRKMIVSHL